MPRPDAMPELLLEQSRAGDEPARGRLLELYRNYLRLMARTLISQPLARPARRLRPGAGNPPQGPSRVRRLPGPTEPELVAWLRQILVRSLSDQVKRHRAGKGATPPRRGPGRDARSLQRWRFSQALAAPLSSPSSIASRREQAVLLADAIERLPADYREVFIARNLEHMPFDQIAERMGRTSGAVRKLWTRTMLSLKRMLEESP